MLSTFLDCWVENFKIIGICHVILCFSYQKLLKRYIEIKVPQRQRKREETIRILILEVTKEKDQIFQISSKTMGKLKAVDLERKYR